MLLLSVHFHFHSAEHTESRKQNPEKQKNKKTETTFGTKSVLSPKSNCTGNIFSIGFSSYRTEVYLTHPF
ncbi:hypothetical protein ACFX13_019894 [Malus domestica]